MKELYLNAEMDVVKFVAEDVIATSGGGAGTVTCPNKLPWEDEL